LSPPHRLTDAEKALVVREATSIVVPSRIIKLQDNDLRRTTFLLVMGRPLQARDGERFAKFLELACKAMTALRPHGLEPPDPGPEAGQGAAAADSRARQWLGVVVGLAEAGLILDHDTFRVTLSGITPEGAASRELPNVFKASAAAFKYLTTWSGPSPSVAQLRAVLEAIEGLVKALEVPDGAGAGEQEDRIVKPFIRLVDALDAIRGFADVVKEWTSEVGRELTIVRESTDRLAEKWGGTFLLVPPAERTQLIDRRKERIEETELEYDEAGNGLRDVGERDLQPSWLRKIVPEKDGEFVPQLVKALDLLRPILKEAERRDSPPPEEPAPVWVGPAVELGNRTDRPKVWGAEKERLTDGEYDVIKVLLEAGDQGVNKDQLVVRSKRSDAVGILKRLRQRDPAWSQAIVMAGRPGAGYRLRSGPRPTDH
jgi:hypothetical protein